MNRATHRAPIIFLALLTGACALRVGHIQRTEPIRTLQFTGSHKEVAQCVRQRLGGRVQDDSIGEKYVIYDSVKGQQQEGLSHYSITVGRSGPGQGFAEWRVIRPEGVRVKAPPLTMTALRNYWNPVEDCAAQAKPAPDSRS